MHKTPQANVLNILECLLLHLFVCFQILNIKVQLRHMAFFNKNIAPEGCTFATLISISSVGTPFFISFLGFTSIELQMDKRLLKSECRFLASNAATWFPSPQVPSLRKRASADYKRHIVFHASACASTFVYIFSIFLNAIWHHVDHQKLIRCERPDVLKLI